MLTVIFEETMQVKACPPSNDLFCEIYMQKQPRKNKQINKQNVQNFKLKYRKAQKSVLSGRFGDPSVQESGRSVPYLGELA